MTIIKLFPRENSKYHFGEHMLESTSLIFHSDSLFSAIINNYRKLYPKDVEYDVENLKNLRLSSMFPAFKDVFFIPKPMTGLNFKENLKKEVRERTKDIKRINFISLKALDDHNNGDLDFNSNVILGRQFLITEDEEEVFKDKNLFDKGEISEEKIAIDRKKNITSEGNLFIVSYIKPQNETYFYFLLDDKRIEGNSKKKLYASIRLIVDEGLGGERSGGSGLFDRAEIEDDDILKSYDVESDYNMSLSLVFPRDKQEFESFKAYQLIERRGFIYFGNGTGLRKKGILMMKEGSIVKGDIDGEIVDVSPNEGKYKIYRFGRFFGIHIKNDTK